MQYDPAMKVPVRQDANGALCFTEIRQLADRTGEIVSNETLRRAMNLADHNDKGITRKGLEDRGRGPFQISFRWNFWMLAKTGDAKNISVVFLSAATFLTVFREEHPMYQYY